MPFTDEDVKWLKEYIEECRKNKCDLMSSPTGMEMILARLEAAEECAEILDAIPGCFTEKQTTKAIIRWRMLAGR